MEELIKLIVNFVTAQSRAVAHRASDKIYMLGTIVGVEPMVTAARMQGVMITF